MRVLVYGLQNSGATLVALFVGQHAGSVVIPDLWTMYRAPRHAFWHDACVKATITTSFPLESHLDAYTPDRTILVLRRPVDNYLRLRSKPFANHDGLLHEKFLYADRIFQERARFDHVVFFEEFGTKHGDLSAGLIEAGWALPNNAASFPRSALEMEQFILDREPELYQHLQWGVGQARVQHLDQLQLKREEDVGAAKFCEQYCPALHEFYDGPRTASTTTTAGSIDTDNADPASPAAQILAISSNFVAFAESRLRKGDASGALEITSGLCRSGYCSPAVWDVHARGMEAAGKISEVEPLLHGLLASSGTDGGAVLQLLAQHAVRTGRLEDALMLAKQSVEHGHDTLAVRLLMARVSLALGNTAASHGYALSALELNPGHAYARRILANTLIDLGRTGEAEMQLEACLKIDPGNKEALRLLKQIQEPSA